MLIRLKCHPFFLTYFGLILIINSNAVNMDLENSNWDQADQDFSIWLNGDKHKSGFPLTDILKSTYLVFHQKQIARISEICNNAFEYFQEQDRKREQKSLEEQLKIGVDSLIHEVAEGYNIPMFRKFDRSLKDQNERTRKNNERIINGVISGDQNIFNELYENEFPKAVRFIVQNSGRVEMAKDVFQDALVIFIEKVYTKKLDLTCSVSTYLYSICRFLWMGQLRQNKREMPLNDTYSYLKDEIIVIGFDDATPDIYENVNSAIEKLGNPCKQLLESYYYKSLSWDEIASSLGYASAASARNQKYKCLERIRNAVNVEVE